MGKLLVVFALFLVVGCSSPAVVAAEADLRAGLLEVDRLAAIAATPEGEAAVDAAAVRVMSLDPTNKTLVSLTEKVRTANANHDADLVHVLASSGVAILTPVVAK